MPRPWDRQKGESQARWHAFQAYRDMGPERSVRRVADKLDRSSTIIGRYSSENNWVERAAAWDDHQDQLRQKRYEEMSKRMGERHATIALAMMEKIVLRLKSMPVEALSAQDLANWLKIAVKIEREAYGEPGEISERRGAGIEIREIINDIKILQTNPESIDAALDRWEATLDAGDRPGALESGESGSNTQG